MSKSIPYSTQYCRKNKISTKMFYGVSKVRQSLRDDCDINRIYKRYCNGEQLPVSSRAYGYLDTVDCPDSLISAKKIVDESQNLFDSMPSEVRAHYGNNVEKFIKGLFNRDSALYDFGVLNRESDVVRNSAVDLVDESNISKQTETSLSVHSDCSNTTKVVTPES